MATFALFIWPVISLVIFSKLGVARGLIWSVAVGYLILPEAFAIDLPGLPPYNKSAAIAVGALLGVVSFSKAEARSKSGMPYNVLVVLILLTALLLLSPIGTVLQNADTLRNGNVIRPALSFRDFQTMLFSSVTLFVPYFLASRYLTRPEHARELLRAIVVLGLGYSFLAIFEMRMSPQLHTWTYGYFQHQWAQHERGGGYRPIVFLTHALWLGFFLMTVALAALALSKRKTDMTARYFATALWIMAILVLSRNFGAILLGFIAAPLILFVSTRLQVRLAAVLAVFFLLCPVIISSGMSPFVRIAEWTQGFAPERAASLAFRLSNEERLVERAMERPWFGWGIWGRPRVFTENGVDLSVSDGIWIVVLGERGWLGFIGQFGLLALPLFALAFRSFKNSPSPEIAGMALIIGVNFLYMIPNSTLSPIGLLMVGTIVASLRPFTSQAVQVNEPDSAPRLRHRTRYTRFPPGSSGQNATAQQPDPKTKEPSPYRRV